MNLVIIALYYQGWGRGGKMDSDKIQAKLDVWEFLRDPQNNKQLNLFSLLFPSFMHFLGTGMASEQQK